MQLFIYRLFSIILRFIDYKVVLLLSAKQIKFLYYGCSILIDEKLNKIMKHKLLKYRKKIVRKNIYFLDNCNCDVEVIFLFKYTQYNTGAARQKNSEKKNKTKKFGTWNFYMFPLFYISHKRRINQGNKYILCNQIK